VKKTVDTHEFLNAINEVLEGRKYITPTVMQDFFNGFNTFNTAQNQLTEKEQLILRYICKGRSNEQIADILSLSEKTIATHKRNIMQKAKVKRSTDLIFWGIEHGYKN
jgi:DNA-binding NarL/FixJ family response regulator